MLKPRCHIAISLIGLTVFFSAFTLLSRAEDAPKTHAIKATELKRTGPLFERVLELNRVQEPELNADAMRSAFLELMTRVRPAVDLAKTPREKIAALNAKLLEERKVSYLSNLYWRDATLAASLLRMRGNCLSTSTLYVLAGEALGLPIRMVLIPRHAFARWDDGRSKINIETTNKGVEYTDRFYLRNASQPAEEDIEKLGWCRSLNPDETVAELHAICAMHRSGENQLEVALKHWEEAMRLAPKHADYRLRWLSVMADIPGRRDEARKRVALIAKGEGNPPPSVTTEALAFLAHDAAATGDHEKERLFLMEAFVQAPKPMQSGVLTELAFCLRALKDYNGAVRYMELAVAMLPDDANELYNLAILQKNAGNLKGALATVEKARKINPESWNLQILHACYLIDNGQTEEGMHLYETIERPRADEEFWEIMQASFWSHCKEREAFLVQFEHALKTARSPRILEWEDQDPDLDFVRDDPTFKALMKTHRQRLVGKK